MDEVKEIKLRLIHMAKTIQMVMLLSILLIDPREPHLPKRRNTVTVFFLFLPHLDKSIAGKIFRPEKCRLTNIY